MGQTYQMAAPQEGPAERVHDGWDGRSRPMHRLDLPCGCRASDVTGYKYDVCVAHLFAAQQRDRAATEAR